jgi:ribosome-associated protein
VKKAVKNVLFGKELVDAIVEEAQAELAENIVVIDLQNVPGATDWSIVCQADASVHVQAIYHRIVNGLIEKGTRPWKHEGEDEGRWILIDFSDVIVHIMLPELREYYKIESVWSDGKKTMIQ